MRHNSIHPEAFVLRDPLADFPNGQPSNDLLVPPRPITDIGTTDSGSSTRSISVSAAGGHQEGAPPKKARLDSRLRVQDFPHEGGKKRESSAEARRCSSRVASSSAKTASAFHSSHNIELENGGNRGSYATLLGEVSHLLHARRETRGRDGEDAAKEALRFAWSQEVQRRNLL